MIANARVMDDQIQTVDAPLLQKVQDLSSSIWLGQISLAIVGRVEGIGQVN
jgi:hypothetical protein